MSFSSYYYLMCCVRVLWLLVRFFFATYTQIDAKDKQNGVKNKHNDVKKTKKNNIHNSYW